MKMPNLIAFIAYPFIVSFFLIVAIAFLIAQWPNVLFTKTKLEPQPEDDFHV